MQKDRASQRTRCLFKARILFQNRNSTLDCVVRNIAASGAKLILDQAHAIPAEFELDIPQRGSISRCRLKWRRGDEVGVEFTRAEGAPIGETPPPDPLAKFRELEEENARLRQVVVELRAQLAEAAVQPSATAVARAIQNRQA